MSISDKDNFQIILLQNYHKKGLVGRLGLVHLILEQITEIYQSKESGDISKDFGLNRTEKLSLLQCASIGYLMMIVEDIALLCISFLNNNSEYYQYLDRKGEEDLGKIISEFYSNFESLTNDDVRKILSIINPNEYVASIEEKNTMITSLQKNITLMKYFIGKTSVFYESHIGIFRRFKHAGFPIWFGKEIPKDHDIHVDFESVTYAFTSRKKIEEMLTALPFSKKAIESYLIFLSDIYQVIYTIINSRLIMLERKIGGVLPSPDNYFSQVLSKNEIDKLKQLDKEFNEKFPPPKEKFHSRLDTLSMTGAWYTYLNSHYSKSVLELSKMMKSDEEKRKT